MNITLITARAELNQRPCHQGRPLQNGPHLKSPLALLLLILQNLSNAQLELDHQHLHGEYRDAVRNFSKKDQISLRQFFQSKHQLRRHQGSHP